MGHRTPSELVYPGVLPYSVTNRGVVWAALRAPPMGTPVGQSPITAQTTALPYFGQWFGQSRTHDLILKFIS